MPSPDMARRVTRLHYDARLEGFNLRIIAPRRRRAASCIDCRGMPMHSAPPAWERLRHHLALAGNSPGSPLDDDALRRAIEECAFRARTDHWTTDRFVSRLCAAINDSPIADAQARNTSVAARAGHDRLVAHLLDWGLTEFFAPT
jgi:hypothetical protein